MGISALVITLNEERNIGECLRGLSWADEIVVVDSLSTDRTVEIARRYTDKVVLREFTGYSDQKSAALALAANEWVLIIDADEVVTPELAAEVRAAVERGDCDGFRIPRLTWFLDRPMRHCGWWPDYQLRLARKAKARFPERLVHETLVVDGPLGTLSNHLIHHSYRTLGDYMTKMVRYADASARQRVNEGRRFRVTDLLVRPGFSFLRMYVLKRGYLDGLHGLVLSVLTAVSVAMRGVYVWDVLRHERPGDPS